MPKTDETPAESEYDGATFEALAGGPTKIILAGLFHEQPKLREASKTQAEWQKVIDKFLADPAE